MFTSCFILHIPFRERIFGTLPRVSPGLTKILFFVFVFVAAGGYLVSGGFVWFRGGWDR